MNKNRGARLYVSLVYTTNTPPPSPPPQLTNYFLYTVVRKCYTAQGLVQRHGLILKVLQEKSDPVWTLRQCLTQQLYLATHKQEAELSQKLKWSSTSYNHKNFLNWLGFIWYKACCYKTMQCFCVIFLIPYSLQDNIATSLTLTPTRKALLDNKFST